VSISQSARGAPRRACADTSHRSRHLHSSGLVEAIKARCRPQIDQYERCLKANPAQPETCAAKLEALWLCTEGPEAQRVVAQQQAADIREG